MALNEKLERFDQFQDSFSFEIMQNDFPDSKLDLFKEINRNENDLQLKRLRQLAINKFQEYEKIQKIFLNCDACHILKNITTNLTATDITNLKNTMENILILTNPVSVTDQDVKDMCRFVEETEMTVNSFLGNFNFSAFVQYCNRAERSQKIRNRGLRRGYGQLRRFFAQD